MSTLQWFCIIAISLFFIQFGQTGSRKPKDYTPEQLRMAPDTLLLGDIKLTLETYLWRDFMPQSPPEGKPLRASLTVKPMNGEYLPSGIDADRIWIMNGREIWSATLADTRTDLPPGKRKSMEKMAREGPKWDPGTQVTVVIQIIDSEGKSYLLKAEDQLIHRTV